MAEAMPFQSNGNFTRLAVPRLRPFQGIRLPLGGIDFGKT
jgi:uncharacterized protein YggT (Ycf19 family)